MKKLGYKFSGVRIKGKWGMAPSARKNLIKGKSR